MATEQLKDDQQAYNGRITSFVALSCAVAASGGILFGYDLGISGGVTSMEPFLKKFFPDVNAKMQESSHTSNYCKFDSQLLTAFTSSLYVAGFFASMCASWVTRAVGRRRSMLLGGASFTAGALLGSLAANIYMLILGRVLLGVGVGFTNQSVPLYLSEMAPPQHRGAINSGFELFVALGVLSANLVNYGANRIHGGWGWRVSLGSAILPATILTVGTLFLPESPSSFIQQHPNSLDEARKILQKIRGTDDVDAELQDVAAAGSTSKSLQQQHPLRTMMQKKYRPQLVIAFLLPFFRQMTGINVITFYSPVIFRTIGLAEDSSLLSTVITGAISTVFIVLAMAIVDRTGRRKLFLIGGVQLLVSHLVVGAILATQLGDHGRVSRGYAYIVLVAVCANVSAFGLSWGPLGWLVPSEIFALEVRSVGQSIVVAVGFLITAIIGQSLLAMLCHLKSGVFFLFGGWMLVMTLCVALFLPETKNLPIEKMAEIWRVHWFWSRVVGNGEATKTPLPLL